LPSRNIQDFVKTLSRLKVDEYGERLVDTTFIKRKCGVFLAVVAAASSPAMANTDWTIKALGTLGGTTNFATGINNLGQAVGYSYTAGNTVKNAFITGADGTGMTSLGTLGGTMSEARGINNSGQVVGWAYSAGSNDRHAFVTGPNGTDMTGLSIADGATSEASSINDSGQVAGWSRSAGSDAANAFITGPDGKGIVYLDSLGGANRSTFPMSVNNTGQVAGFSWVNNGADERAFITGLNGTGITSLGTLGTGPFSYSYALSINNSGQVVGSSSTNSGDSAFITGANGTGMTSLGFSGGRHGVASDINDKGQVVGWGDTAHGTTDAFFYSDGNMTDLSELPSIAEAGWINLRPEAINNEGQIAGHGILNGSEQAFLLSPIPEPKTYAMLLAGVGLMGFMARRRKQNKAD
jgi:probable HAF family extracellular repeat protein